MAKIIVGSYLVRYPLGGMASYVLQYLIGLKRLGHTVVFVEKAAYQDACFDPRRGEMTDDPSTGMQVAASLFSRFGLNDGICFVDVHGRHHGLSDREVEHHFASCDAFIDMGTHGAWAEPAQYAGVRVLLDGEPGFNQIKLQTRLEANIPEPEYDIYVTNGMNIGTPASSAPTAGKTWHHLPHPVVTSLFKVSKPPPGAPFSTVMNWQSHQPIEYRGVQYGQKDVEFERFVSLPSIIDQPLEVAVAGVATPLHRLHRAGWRTRDAHEVTATYDSFHAYIAASAGEFAVCKNVFVALNTGWFSDRSAAYLAQGRPVVMQDTGFSAHLPVGAGLFAVHTVEEAAEQLMEAVRDYPFHARHARSIAEEHLDTGTVLKRLTDLMGL